MPERSSIQCFFLELTDRSRRYLRRYHSGECAAGPGDWNGHDGARPTYCNERVELDEVEGNSHTSGDLHPHDDPRWPTSCSRCGHDFQDDDPWQLFCEGIYRRQDTGDLMTLSDAPAGAMWHADWMTRRGPDGHALMVRTPAGDWSPDWPSSDGGGWTRTGEPPNVTARPSIGQGRVDGGAGWAYHGFLTGGILKEC